MEHVSGETLAARLKRGALPLDEVLRHGGERLGAAMAVGTRPRIGAAMDRFKAARATARGNHPGGPGGWRWGRRWVCSRWRWAAGHSGAARRPGTPRVRNRPFRLDPAVGRDWVALETAHIAVPPDGRRLAMSVEA